jgi:flagellar biosynthesis GTPase FlhF
MIIKTFTADSMAAALKLVRSELGKDSVVLKTREIPVGPGNGRVEITACTERPLPAPAPPTKTLAASARTSVKPFTPPPVANRLQSSNVVATPDPIAFRLEQIEAALNRLAAAPESGPRGSKLEPLRTVLRNADVPSRIIDELLGLADTAQVRARLTDRFSNLIAPSISFVKNRKSRWFRSTP